MLQLAFVLSLTSLCMGQDAFFERYSLTKTFASCFGDELYYASLVRIGQAERECQQLPVSNLHRVDSSVFDQMPFPHNIRGLAVYIPFPNAGQVLQHSHPHFHYVKKRHAEEKEEAAVEEAPEQAKQLQQLEQQPQEQQQREPFFDRHYLVDSVNKIMAALSNYTCTLNKVGFVDEYLNVNVTGVVEHYKAAPLADTFKKDLIEGITYCAHLTQCVPLEKLNSPLPVNLQRLLMVMKCEKEARLNACFKEDLRKNLGEFDLSLFGSDESEDVILNKLSAIVMGVDSLNELEIF